MANELAAALNRDCYCIGVNKDVLRQSLEAHLRDAGLPEQLLDENRHLFAASPVFLAEEHLQEMKRLIHSVETIAHNDAYRESVLAGVPLPTPLQTGSSGVFFGYDFHLGAEGPRLIEINTNAGGVLLTLYLASAQQACCDEVSTFFAGQTSFSDAERKIVSMFQEECSSQMGDRSLRTIAIVDNEPSSQFLYPEFRLFKSLFERHGIDAIIADPGDLSISNNALYSGGQKIDLVYNRLTDFYLDKAESNCLREAYQKGLAVLTPSPYHYALYADKRNLPLLSDPSRLRNFGVEEDVIAALGKSLPAAVPVTSDNAAQLWSDRKRYFFKPTTGHGSRGVYRGAKLTKRVWNDIVHGDYIAQVVAPPSERQLIIDGKKQSLKLDIRCVSYKGEVQQISARLYQGQTTNLRTEGGGLATVFATPGVNLSWQS